MPELIDRHALLKNVYGNPPEKATMTHAEWYRKCIYEAPKVESEPVRHGRWIELPKALDASENPCECSACGHCLSFYNYYPKSKFCPNCGAKMDLRTPTEVQLDEADSVMMGDTDDGNSEKM